MSEFIGENERKLKRVLGFPAAYGAAVGLVVSGTAMFSVGNVGAISANGTWIAALIALVPMMAAAFSYGELTAMLPGGGMISDYTMPALGRFWSVFALLSGYVLLIACDGGTQLVMGGLSFESLVGIPQPVITFALLAIIILVNIFGVEFYGRAEASVTIIMMIVFFVLAIAGFAGVGESMGAADPSVGGHLGPLPEGGMATVFGTVGVAIWFFIGFEFACPMAEENKKPFRNIPYGLIFGLLTIYIVDIIFVFAAVRYTPLEVMGSSAIPHVEAAKGMLGFVGGVTMSLLTVGASFTTANAYCAALPRMLYGMSREHLVPLVFGKIHPKYRTPIPGLIFTTLLILSTVIYITVNGANVDLVLTFIMTACITWMISYAIAMIDVLVLRKKYPDFPRLWKAPLAWVTLPIGIIGVGYAISTLPDYWLPAAICMAVVAAYAIIWMKTHGIKIGEKVSLEAMAKDIRERSEYLPEWDEAVAKWLEERKAG
ncbi:MAG: APC family permease [Clostridiales Family XIII bacterium]|jgi:amino acid transporter|nr:APC family permease [Clostridiales Family XIII bacterium]